MSLVLISKLSDVLTPAWLDVSLSIYLIYLEILYHNYYSHSRCSTWTNSNSGVDIMTMWEENEVFLYWVKFSPPVYQSNLPDSLIFLTDNVSECTLFVTMVESTQGCNWTFQPPTTNQDKGGFCSYDVKYFQKVFFILNWSTPYNKTQH